MVMRPVSDWVTPQRERHVVAAAINHSGGGVRRLHSHTGVFCIRSVDVWIAAVSQPGPHRPRRDTLDPHLVAGQSQTRSLACRRPLVLDGLAFQPVAVTGHGLDLACPLHTLSEFRPKAPDE